ncbi:MAG: type II toxin-antitoxin system HicA family toxin [Candidatus Parcubacteria bacterium]|nr:type II toxin-antitoxin system HicA family toxin [Candidatus Parcubacteria bacterium]
MPKVFSSKKIITILCKDFGFYVVSQKGSHIKLRKISRNRKITTIIPLHKELASGTLRGVLELAEIELKEFLTKF